MESVDPLGHERDGLPEGPRAAGSGDVTGPIGVLAIQGSFALHARSLAMLGVPCREVRNREDLDGLQGLILPGGESTTISLLMEECGIFEPIRRLGLDGLPMFGTCAGAILLGRGAGIPRRLELAPLELRRNAYGTQVDSFSATLALTPFREPFHGIFIRAPRIVGVGQVVGVAARDAGSLGPRGPDGIEVLGEHGGTPVLVAWGNFLLSTFHPELTDDLRIHRLFLDRFVLGDRRAGVGAKDAAGVVETVAAR